MGYEERDAAAGEAWSDPPPEGGEFHDEASTRRHLEGVLRETVRRAIERGLEAGMGTLNRTDKTIRGIVGGELPREVVSYFFSQVDETKNALVRVVAREVRDFLDATDISAELQKALTSLSFEVRTEIRFIPNEAGGVRPSVRTVSAPRRRRWGRDSQAPRAEDAPDAAATPDPRAADADAAQGEGSPESQQPRASKPES